jgi:hypothetical protein
MLKNELKDGQDFAVSMPQNCNKTLKQAKRFCGKDAAKCYVHMEAYGTSMESGIWNQTYSSHNICRWW